MLRSAAMLRPIVITALIAAGLCSVAHADVYRWVDDKGQPHYTDRWVPGSQLISSSRPHASTLSDSSSSSSDPSKAVNSANQQTDDKAAAKKNAEAAKADVAKMRQQQCKEAKDRYQKAIEARRIYNTQGSDGERSYMSDDEADKYRAQARADVTTFCGSAPPPVQAESPAPSEHVDSATPTERPE